MKLLNFTIIKLTLCLIIGILIGYKWHIPIDVVLPFTGAVLLVLFGFYLIERKQFIKNVWFGITAFILMICIGLITQIFHNQKNFTNHYSHIISLENDSLKMVTFRVREVLKPGNYYNKYIIDILKVEGYDTSGKLLLNIQKDSLKSPLKVDDILIIRTSFKELIHPLNPYQFDYRLYLEKQYIYHQIFTKKNALYKVKEKNQTLFGIANQIREHLNSKLKSYNFKKDELAIINALLLGQRQDISESVFKNYTNAGAIHILAVSGLHVGIILIILSFVLKPLEHFKNGKKLKTILLVTILWSFAIIAGLSASVTRAVTMFSIVTIGLNYKRPSNIFNTLAISIFIILLFKPMFLFDVGFQLSYLAVFAIVSIDPLIYRLWKPNYWIIDKFWHTLTVTFSAQFGILPISLYYFHQFPGLFFLSNLIIIPFLGFILGLGIVVMVLATLNILPDIGAKTFGNIIGSMNDFVGWIASKNQFVIKDISFSILYVLVFYLSIIAFIKLYKKRNYKNLRWFFISVFLIQGAFIYTKFSKSSNQFIVFHKSRHTIIGINNKNTFLVADDLQNKTQVNDKIITDYMVGNHIKTIEKDSLKPLYIFDNKKLLIVDSLSVYNVKSFNPDYVLLRQSPKINLNRLIDSIKPKSIIADGSNFKSYIEKWETICSIRKLPFHQTSKKGAYIIDF